MGLAGAIAAIAKAVLAVEVNGRYRTTVLGEPQLGPRGLYPTLSTRDSGLTVRRMLDLLAIADMLGVPVWELSVVARQLLAHELLAECDVDKRKEGLRA